MREELLNLSEVERHEIKDDAGRVLLNIIVTETNKKRIDRGLKPQGSVFYVKYNNKTYGPTQEIRGSTVIENDTSKFDIDDLVTDVVGSSESKLSTETMVFINDI